MEGIAYMTKDIKLYNTKSRKIETFVPITPLHVGIYSCGPTVYHYVHLGNLRAFIFADTLHRLFLYAHYEVKHVMNITDVGHLVSDGDDGEDKLEKGAKREGKTAWEVAAFYTEAFFNDITALGIHQAEYLYPRATDTIQEQIDLIKLLEEKGYTYTITDGVYFDTAKFREYADFAHLDIEGLKSGARVEENKEKKNATDFALWKCSPKDGKRDMEWQSPWGKGFPGWHIECSAMSKKILGSHFDIHTGGIDHIPVHHTNEIAQSECANGVTYVTYWMHNNFLNDKSGKMAKSSGDFLRLQSIIHKGISPLAFRYYVLTAHYRKELEFSFEALEAASVAYTKLRAWCADHKTETGTVIQSYQEAFEQALYDDMNTPQILALIWSMLREARESEADIYTTLLEMDKVLGLNLAASEKIIVQLPEAVHELVTKREQAREVKDWSEADRLRDELATLGFTVKDTNKGQEIQNNNQRYNIQ
jgi:cysteinyl-tRNA synthetase